MNRYPLWKYLLIALALALGLLYTLPNFYGEAPAVLLVAELEGCPYCRCLVFNQRRSKADT